MTILVTGGAGFIGFHTIQRLLTLGHTVVSVDNMNEYYDVNLKRARLKELEGIPRYSFHQSDILEYPSLERLARSNSFDCIIHLAALAGVRYSLDHGIDYIRTNLEGTYNLLEIARHYSVPQVIYASSSSVYGEGATFPSSEEQRVDTPVSLYAATKKSNELMAYTYSHLFGIRTVGLRFFTVYGPWGRPDMALFIFTKGILEGKPINVNNHGKMKRDFTYIDDIVNGITASLAHNAQYDVFNLGNGTTIGLMEFINLIEKGVGKKATINFLPMQAGDVKESLADITRAQKYLHYRPLTPVAEGVGKFLNWYRGYYTI